MKTWAMVGIFALLTLVVGCKPQAAAGGQSADVQKLQNERAGEQKTIVALHREAPRTEALLQAAQAQQKNDWVSAAAWMQKANDAAPEESVAPPESVSSLPPAEEAGAAPDPAASAAEQALSASYCNRFPGDCFPGKDGLVVPYGDLDRWRHQRPDQESPAHGDSVPPLNWNAFPVPGIPVDRSAPPPQQTWPTQSSPTNPWPTQSSATQPSLTDPWPTQSSATQPAPAATEPTQTQISEPLTPRTQPSLTQLTTTQPTPTPQSLARQPGTPLPQPTPTQPPRQPTPAPPPGA
jgi:hypothetical protein